MHIIINWINISFAVTPADPAIAKKKPIAR